MQGKFFPLSESRLMKKLILEGIKGYQLKKAIEMYINKEVDLANASRIANISIREMMSELEKREIPIYSSIEMFKQGLENLASLFDDRTLLNVVKT